MGVLQDIAAAAGLAVDSLVTITGRVTDPDGNPVALVEVYQDLAGTLSGLTTDQDGRYQLLAVPLVNVHFDHVAYINRTVAAPQQSGTVDIVLTPLVVDIPEVEILPDDQPEPEQRAGWGWIFGILAAVGAAVAWKRSSS